MVKSHVRRKPVLKGELPLYQHPGKFEGELRLTEFIWDLTVQGFSDAETGSVETGGYHSLVHLGPEAVDDIAKQAKENGAELTADEREFIRQSAGVILSEGSTGFVYAAYYDSTKQLDLAWAHLEWEEEHAAKVGTGQQQLSDYGYIGDD